MCRTTSIDGSTPPHFFRDVFSNCWDAPTRLRDMYANNIAMQVLSTVPVMFSHWAKPQHALDVHRWLNDHLAGICSADRAHFTGLAVLPLQDPDLACRELDRCINHLGLAGVQIGTHINGINLDDPTLFPFFERCHQLNACIFVHPWDMLGGSRLERYWMPWLVGMPTETTVAILSITLGGILDRLPNLRVCFAHAGGSFPGTLGRISHGFDCRRDLFPATARHPRDFLRSSTREHAAFWVDSLTHDAPTLRALLTLMGPQRIALGSDYPFPLGEDQPGVMIRAMPDLAENEKAWLLAEAAREFLGHHAPI
jgi:aminocarboxymuconate-semialdehyde decarboxylase